MEWKKYVVENYLGETDGEYDFHKPAIQKKLYKELTSGEESKILGAAKVLIGLDDLNFSNEQVKEIESKCSNLPRSEGKSMRDYRQDVNAALMLIKHFQGGAKCKCEAYTNWIQFPVEKEIEIGYLKQLSEPFVNHEKYQIEQDVQCKVCGIAWQVNRNDGYHYPVWEWIKK